MCLLVVFQVIDPQKIKLRMTRTDMASYCRPVINVMESSKLFENANIFAVRTFDGVYNCVDTSIESMNSDCCAALADTNLRHKISSKMICAREGHMPASCGGD